MEGSEVYPHLLPLRSLRSFAAIFAVWIGRKGTQGAQRIGTDEVHPILPPLRSLRSFAAILRRAELDAVALEFELRVGLQRVVAFEGHVEAEHGLRL